MGVPIWSNRPAWKATSSLTRLNWPKTEPEAKELAADLEKLGPTFIKLGQLLSTRADLLPVPYLEALSRLQDHIEPFPYEEVDRIVSSELGVRISKAFAEFDREPLAAASLAQVHRAYMRDGRAVVVKVQRPNIREQIVRRPRSPGGNRQVSRRTHRSRQAIRVRQPAAEFASQLVARIGFQARSEQPPRLR